MSNTKEYFRDLYPYLKSGKIYFNHAALSPFSIPVRNKVDEYLIMRSETDIDNYPWVNEAMMLAKQKTGELLGTDADRIAYVDNTSNGLNILAQGMDWNSGDEIILNDIEFPSNVYPFLNLKKHGVEVKFAKSTNGTVSAEDIISLVTPRTRLISISFVQFLSGYRADMKMLGDYCQQHNIIFCVDAIQGLGAVNLNVTDCHVDFLACGTQKWLMGLMGLAFVYVSERLQDILNPGYVGWTSVENTWELLNYDFVLKKTADAFQNGTVNAIGVMGYLGALEVFEQSGAQKREDWILDNTEYFMHKLAGIGYQPTLYGVPRQYLSGIVSFASPYAKRLFNKLAEINVVCSLREGMIRFSPHYYNTFDEIDQVVERLQEART